MDEITQKLAELMSEVRVLKNSFETYSNGLDTNLKESFSRVHERADDLAKELGAIQKSRATTGCAALHSSNKDIETLQITVFGKDGRGGVIYDIADIKKFMYKWIGFATAINLGITIGLGFLL